MSTTPSKPSHIIQCDTGLQAENIPCYLDEVSPKSYDFPEGHRYGERPWDFGKIWWSLRLAQLGYTSLYLDNDVAAVKDPLAANIMQSPYDLEVRHRHRSLLVAVNMRAMHGVTEKLRSLACAASC